MRIKLLFFLPNLNGGGAERVVVNIIRLLDLKKFEVTVVLVKKTGILLGLIPPKIEIIDLSSKKAMFSILKLRKAIKLIKPEIIFSTHFRAHVAIDISLTNFKKKPKLIFRCPTSPKSILKYKQLNLLMRKLLEKAYKNANIIVAQTSEMKEEIIYYHGIQSYKIKVLINPLDTMFIDEKIKHVKNPFDLDCKNVVAAGRLIFVKGFDVLIHSFKKVVEQDNKFRLHIIGEDKGEGSHLKRLAASLGISNYIYFLGYQINPYKYFHYSDLYVLSSRWEGLPNTILENLYLKKPIVATRCIPFMDTLIVDGKNGILVDVEDQEALTAGILNYKKINSDYQTINFNSTAIEDIFY